MKCKNFRHFCVTIGNLPSSYVDSMSYYELLMWFSKFLTETVIPAINDNAEAVKEIQQWITTLDLQDEVNKKLDEMAESGQLTELISAYLNIKSQLCFDTVEQMKQAINLVDGSFVKTYGFNSLNDGGSSLYKIRTILNTDVVNEKSIISLHNETLIAELIKDEINIKQYGAFGDGLHDDTNSIQLCIDENPHRDIIFPKGEYLISNPIDIKVGNEYQVNLKLNNNAKLFSNTEINSLLRIGYLNEGTYNRYTEGNIVTIEGGIFDCSNTQRAIYLTSDRKQTRLLNINIINVSTIGIYIDRSLIGGNMSSDALLSNISITGDKDYSNDSVGLYLYGSDNEIDELRITGVKKCVYSNGGGNLFSNAHLTCSYDEIDTTKINNSIGFDLYSGANHFSNIYVDTYGKCFVLNNDNSRNYFSNIQVFYYLSNSSSDYRVFEYNARSYVKCTESFFELGGNGTTQIVKLNNSVEYNTRKYPTLKRIVNFINCDATGITTEKDLFFEKSCNNRFVKYDINQNPWSISMQQNKWYQIALLSGGLYKLDIQVANDQYSTAIIRVHANATITCTDLSHSNSHSQKYEIALANNFTDSTVSNLYSYLCIRALDSDSSLNVCLSNISENWGTEIYMVGKTEPLSNPSVVISSNLRP